MSDTALVQAPQPGNPSLPAKKALVVFEVELIDAKLLYSTVRNSQIAQGVPPAEVEEWLGTPEEPNLLACIRLALDHGGSPAGLSVHDSSSMWMTSLQSRASNACRQCGSDIQGGYCSDSTCAYSDWPQCIPPGVLQNSSADEISVRYGIDKRAVSEPG